MDQESVITAAANRTEEPCKVSLAFHLVQYMHLFLVIRLE